MAGGRSDLLAPDFCQGRVLKPDCKQQDRMSTSSGGRVVLLLGVAFLLLSGEIANADPVGDFFKKLGRSISKAFHPQPTHRTRKKSTTKQSSPQELNSVEASPSPRVEPLKSQAEAMPTPAVRRASAASPAKRKQDMPFGIPVPDKKGFVTSPYLPDGDYVDVSAFAPGTAVRDPYTGKFFRVP